MGTVGVVGSCWCGGQWGGRWHSRFWDKSRGSRIHINVPLIKLEVKGLVKGAVKLSNRCGKKNGIRKLRDYLYNIQSQVDMRVLYLKIEGMAQY